MKFLAFQLSKWRHICDRFLDSLCGVFVQRKKPTHMDRQGQLPSSNDGCPCGFCDQRPALTNSSSLSLSRPNSHWNRESDAGWSHCQRPLLMAGRSECGSTKTLRTASASRAGLGPPLPRWLKTAPTPGHEGADVLSRERAAHRRDASVPHPTWLSPFRAPPRTSWASSGYVSVIEGLDVRVRRGLLHPDGGPALS